jgi:predicted ATPase
MLERLYAHNYRCFENFELITKDQPSILLVGKNGAGKSTARNVLELFQKIARGTNRVRDLIDEPDFAMGRTTVPIRFRIEVDIKGSLFAYELAFELPERFKELRVLNEQLEVDGTPIFSRNLAQVNLLQRSAEDEDRVSQFSVDWHLVALPLIHARSEDDYLSIFRSWASRMVILAPIADNITGTSKGETLEPKRDGSDVGAWFTGVLGRTPSAYSMMDKYLRQVFPDFNDIVNETVGIDARSLLVRFASAKKILGMKLEDLADGERCLFLSAVLLAAHKTVGPLFCFWDEPDNYLSLTEVGQFVTELRRDFAMSGQIIVTSHHPESIRRFSGENTFVLMRRTHLEPTMVRLLEDIKYSGDLINSMILGDLFDGIE